MDKNSVKLRAIECLKENASFLEKYFHLCNVHTVDFITGEKWCLIPSELRKELCALNCQQLKDLPKEEIPEFLNERDFPELYSFVSGAKAHTLGALNVTTSLSKFLSIPLTESSDVSSQYWCMSPKKSHEVKAMAAVISSFAKKYDIKTVVDIGSGKGYLSSYLALEKNLNVLGIDQSSGNTVRAGNRSEKVSCFLSRSKNKQKENALKNCYQNSEINDAVNVYGKKCKENAYHSNSEKSTLCSPGIFVSKTCSVHESTNISMLVKDFLHHQHNSGGCSDAEYHLTKNISTTEDEVMFCALHGCGNLSSTLLKLYISTNQAKIVCCVGCCYNHIEEHFFKNPFSFYDTSCSEFGFPLSSVLLATKYSLGRNARMLASQSIDRITRNESLHSKSLFYRAVLQTIINDVCEEIPSNCHVGKIASKCSGFVDYVQKALLKLNLYDVQLSSLQIEEYLNKYSDYDRKLYALQLLRIILSPCIEALILLDRLVFLLEQECVKEAYIVQLFDPVTSPRCYGLISVKC